MTPGAPDATAARRRQLVFALAASSIVVTIIGAFWMRLWVLGLVIGVIALVVALRADRRSRRGPGVVVSVIAVALAVAVGASGVVSGLRRAGPAVPSADAQEIDVRMQVEAEGAFEVSHTEPGDDGSGTIVQTESVDRLDVTWSGSLDEVQLVANIAQDNIGPQVISCRIWVDGALAVDRTGDARFVDCSAALQGFAAR